MESFRLGGEVTGGPLAKPQLSDAAIASLHAALGKEIADRDPVSSLGLKDAVRLVCGEARVKNWPPESLLIAVKSALQTVPAVQGRIRGPDRDEFLGRIVTLCIDEYYASLQR